MFLIPRKGGAEIDQTVAFEAVFETERETMASAEGLVPITREYLSAYYDKYPLDPVVPDVTR